MNKIKLGGRSFTPTKVICVGINYMTHIREMGGDQAPSEPVIFLKPNSAVYAGGGELPIPASYGLLHHEVELCFMIGKRVSGLSPEAARSCIAGYGVGIDFTLRNRQSRARSAGLPWELAKGFDRGGCFGDFVEASAVQDPDSLSLKLSVNGELRQDGNTDQMIVRPPDLISFVSKFMTLEEGDLFMTGTPEGVGEVLDGDRIHAEIDHLPSLDLLINRR